MSIRTSLSKKQWETVVVILFLGFVALFYVVLNSDSGAGRFLRQEYIPRADWLRTHDAELIVPGSKNLQGLFGYSDVSSWIYYYDLPAGTSMEVAKSHLIRSMTKAGWEKVESGRNMEWMRYGDGVTSHARIAIRKKDKRVFCCKVADTGRRGTTLKFYGSVAENYAKDHLWPLFDQYVSEAT